MNDRVQELKSWDDVKLLTVKVDRLTTWHRPGLLCIGDAAHAMSPVGGVGINLAVQDAIAAANRLANRCARGWSATTISPPCSTAACSRRGRRSGLQVLMQNNVLRRVLASRETLRPPWPVRLLGSLSDVAAHSRRGWSGIGVRPEHVRTPEAVPARA